MTTCKRYRAEDWSEAQVALKIFEDPAHGLHRVTLSLPPGMDIAPDVWCFEKAAEVE